MAVHLKVQTCCLESATLFLRISLRDLLFEEDMETDLFLFQILPLSLNGEGVNARQFGDSEGTTRLARTDGNTSAKGFLTFWDKHRPKLGHRLVLPALASALVGGGYITTWTKGTWLEARKFTHCSLLSAYKQITWLTLAPTTCT
jgi:hypothetical protein